MDRWWMLGLAALPLVAWSQADDITYKGVPLGAAIEEFKAKLPDHKCYDSFCMYASSHHCLYRGDSRGGIMSGPETTACRERNSFGGVDVLSANSQFREGKLVQVVFSFSVPAFDVLAGAAKERLGEPTSVVDREVQTRMGATYQNRHMVWERPTMVLVIARYGSTIDKGMALLTTRQERERKEAELEAKKKKGAKDF